MKPAKTDEVLKSTLSDPSSEKRSDDDDNYDDDHDNDNDIEEKVGNIKYSLFIYDRLSALICKFM